MTDITLEIDDLLEEMVMEDRKHFAPHYICNRLGTADIQEVTNYLFTLVPRKLTLKLEVECPEGHSDFEVVNEVSVPAEVVECSYCGIEYLPDPKHIWMSFDFTPVFIEHVKKKKENRAYHQRLVGSRQLVCQ